jgi:galactokinase
LFGEHQDYLKLPVITAAIDLRINIHGKKTEEKRMYIHLPDIESEESLPLLDDDELYVYDLERDYFKSIANVLIKQGIRFRNGCHCEVRGSIPINSGTSSSSALNVAWCQFLLELNRDHNPDIHFDPAEIARFAYLAEVEEFGEPGGMMDHYATAIGGVLYQEFNSHVDITEITTPLNTFVLGDSQQPKDTKQILHQVKFGVLDAIEIIKKSDSSFSLQSVSQNNLNDYTGLLSPTQMEVLSGAVLNRDMTQTARQLLNAKEMDHKELGKLLTEHHKILSDKLKISTAKIDHMLEEAIRAGAYGGKINGSGGGGCMFVYAPENPSGIAQAIESARGMAYIIKIDQGLKISSDI